MKKPQSFEVIRLKNYIFLEVRPGVVTEDMRLFPWLFPTSNQRSYAVAKERKLPTVCLFKGLFCTDSMPGVIWVHLRAA